MQQDNCSSSSQYPEVFPVCVANSAILGLCFVLGVPGNVAVLVILFRRLKENSFTIRLMLSLVVSDLLILLPLPVWIWALLNGWIFGSAACKIISYTEYWCVFCSAFCVTLMSIQRYMQVLHPQNWAKLGARGENGLLCGIWILSGVLSSYSPAQREVGCEQYGFQYCYQQFRNNTDKVATLVLEILQFVACFFLLVYFYCRLHRGVRQSPFYSSNRMAKLVSRIITAFFIFYILVPIANISSIIAVLLKNENLVRATDLGGKMARALTFLNSFVNPFLYAFSLRGLQCRGTVTEST